MKLSEITQPTRWLPSREAAANWWRHNHEEMHLARNGCRVFELDKTNPKIRVVAFDPGGTTGWSVMETTLEALNDNTVPVHEILTGWWHGQIVCNDEKIDNYEQVAIDAMAELITAQVVDVDDIAIVVESYQIRSKRTDKETISPIRFIAGIEQYVWDMYRYMAQQGPSEKTGVTDERLETWGLYLRDGQQHARDADRHALLFLKKLRAKKSLQRKHFPRLGL
ncbi:resolvase [Rhodococcus phage ChewyVIII]|uniref:Resolvase n=1 Tax=Rhodococcus phage ChewyVIII TaxID=1887657 RepID=A0A1C9EIB8_9CAUD|nr:resolvase [Rhodococcus phage ChewyVIII]AON97490.1 resolvase [Rhodococcus phage ChewyVIII]